MPNISKKLRTTQPRRRHSDRGRAPLPDRLGAERRAARRGRQVQDDRGAHRQPAGTQSQSQDDQAPSKPAGPLRPHDPAARGLSAAAEPGPLRLVVAAPADLLRLPDSALAGRPPSPASVPACRREAGALPPRRLCQDDRKTRNAARRQCRPAPDQRSTHYPSGASRLDSSHATRRTHTGQRFTARSSHAPGRATTGQRFTAPSSHAPRRPIHADDHRRPPPVRAHRPSRQGQQAHQGRQPGTPAAKCPENQQPAGNSHIAIDTG